MAWLRRIGLFSIGNPTQFIVCPHDGWPDYYSIEQRNSFGGIRLPFADAVKFFYRVKHWQFSVDFPGWNVEINTFLREAPTDQLDGYRGFVIYKEAFLSFEHCYYFSYIKATDQRESPPKVYSSFLAWHLGLQVPVMFPDKTYGIKFFDIGTGIEESEYLGDLTFRFVAKHPNPSQQSPGEIIMTPRKWWQYDPGDGLGPIYDEDSGQQIRKFPTF